MVQYNHQEIEARWSKKWDELGLYKAEDFSKKPKYYLLVEFPYPSGEGLHVGHPRSFTAMDVVARQRRMAGQNVLYPMGFDSFGLPSENYAIKTGVHPAITTAKNEANFTRQLKSLGFSFDWSRTFSTTDPAYYKWTQWIFLQLYKHGLAYKSKMPINWCLSCKIGLANEEVVNGKCERCGGVVEKREKEQWMLRITAYADRLISDLEIVDYLEQIKTQQINWIGRSEGAEIEFKITNGDSIIKVFTTRPDTLFGATYLVLSPEHELISQLSVTNEKEVQKYIQAANKKSELERTELQKEKTGVELKGVKAINLANGEEIPIFVADYVLSGYGTGAIMAVPAHDERDLEFARKYHLPIVPVVSPTEVRYVVVEKSLPADAVAKLENYGEVIVDKTDKGWGKFFVVKVTIEKENDFIAFLESNLLPTSDGGGAWYADSMNSTNVVVFPNKHFRLWNNDVLQEQIEYGRSVGLPDKQTQKDFAAFVDSDDSALINSGEFNGQSSIEAGPKIAAKVGGKLKTQYKLRDWVFSRQRYWGEPIPMVWCEHCQQQIESSATAISFYRQDTWQQLTSGRKTVETRALNPEEPERFFGNVGVGQFLKAVNKETWDERYFKVTAVWQFKSIEELYKKHPELHEQIWPGSTGKTLQDWLDGYAKSGPEYLDKIKKNGLIAWAVEAVIPGWVPLPEDQLPLELPAVEKYQPTDNGESPLAVMTDWVNTTCPNCGGTARRETDTMPNWAGSSWYFLRYIDPQNNQALADSDKMKYWAPVDWYNGGMEHTTLHLLYSRFWYKFLYDIGAVPKECGSEPYKKRTAQGMILGEGGEKMSKSRGNVINPDSIVDKYGADTLRVYIMFMGPFDQAIPWDTNGVLGVRRFLDKVSSLAEKVTKKIKDDTEVLRVLHQTVKKVTDDIAAMRFNTAVSALMILTNKLHAAPAVSSDSLATLLKLLAPFAPYITEELWSQLGQKGSIHQAAWPEYDAKLTQADEAEIVVQINGKRKCSFVAPATVNKVQLEQLALQQEKVVAALTGQTPTKVIVVPGRLVNIVLVQ